MILSMEMFSIGWDVFSGEGENLTSLFSIRPLSQETENRKSSGFEDDYGDLANLATKCLNRDGLLFCSTNFRGMTFNEFLRILQNSRRPPV